MLSGGMSGRGDPTSFTPRLALRSRAAAVAAGLAICAALAPLGLTLPDGGRLIGAFPFWLGAGLLFLLLAGPAGAALLVALRGLPAVLADFAARPDSEHEQGITRIFFATGVLAYGLALAWLLPERAGTVAAAASAAVGLAVAWLLLAAIVLRPDPLAPRRVVATLVDVGALSAFLHFGAELTAAWYPVYLWIAFNGFRYGTRSLVLSVAATAIAFAAVVVTTPFWAANPALGIGLILALIVLPVSVAALLRSLGDARREAEQANAAKSRLLTTLSHELRTPLATIIATQTQIERTELDQNQRDLLGIMQAAAKTLLGLVDALLDLARIDGRRPDPPLETFDLHEIVHSTVATLRGEAAAKNLQIALRIAADLPPSLRGSPHQLRQILLNLVANGIRLSEQGRVQVTIDGAARDATGLRLRIAVRDHGAGIPRDVLAGIDELLARPEAARAIEGMGLGLAIVKQLVAAADGTMAVTSEAGAGSTFTVEIPFAIDASAALARPDLAGRAVCVVTTDEILAAELEAMLTLWRAEPYWIGAAAQAAEQIAEAADALSRPAVLIDGRSDPVEALTLARRLAAEFGALEPALFVIADAMAMAAVASLAEATGATVLAAPVDETALANALRFLPPPAAFPRASAPPAARIDVSAIQPSLPPEAAARPAPPAAAPPQPASAASPASVVTPISSHPRFPTPESSVVVDDQAIEALRSLGAGSDFFHDVIQTFRGDAREVLAQLRRCAAAGDVRQFKEQAHALRSSAANVGGARLCAALLALREVTGAELRLQGGELVDRIAAELARLDAALDQKMREAGRG
jgi:two-component system sensor histidine kinase RpfC